MGKEAIFATTTNIKKYQKIYLGKRELGELSLACVLHSNEMESDAILSVHEFANTHSIRNIRFKPVLPIGRALKKEIVSEALSSFTDIEEILSNGYTPVKSCGLGNNLYVEPNGDVFPCYAFKNQHTNLGNILTDGLEKIIKSDRFTHLLTYTVDTNQKCSKCIYRYLCGGACRSWGGKNTQYSLDTPPPNCEGLYKRAEEIYNFAFNYLKKSKLIRTN